MHEDFCCEKRKNELGNACAIVEEKIELRGYFLLWKFDKIFINGGSEGILCHDQRQS